MSKDSWSEEEIEHFKEIILQKRKDTIEEIKGLEESTNVSSNNSGDDSYSYHMADMGTNSQEREKDYLLISREKEFLSHLNSALNRIKDEDYEYGRCIECRELIPKERLEEVPHTQHCTDCKS